MSVSDCRLLYSYAQILKTAQQVIRACNTRIFVFSDRVSHVASSGEAGEGKVGGGGWEDDRAERERRLFSHDTFLAFESELSLMKGLHCLIRNWA